MEAAACKLPESQGRDFWSAESSVGWMGGWERMCLCTLASAQAKQRRQREFERTATHSHIRDSRPRSQRRAHLQELRRRIICLTVDYTFRLYISLVMTS
jgi:hypothetical protein